MEFLQEMILAARVKVNCVRSKTDWQNTAVTLGSHT